MIKRSDFELLVERCRVLPPAQEDYYEGDYITNLLLTVLDFRMGGHTINNAIDHYKKRCWKQIRTLDQLEDLLSRHPDNPDGNTKIALHLWRYRLWTRIVLLRRLTAYFRSIEVTSQDKLSRWAWSSDYERDFKGKIPGMGLAIYKWLVMRQGVQTFKPDIHVRRFIKSVIRRNLRDSEIVEVLEEVAHQLGVGACKLDWAIWEYQRGAAGR